MALTDLLKQLDGLSAGLAAKKQALGVASQRASVASQAYEDAVQEARALKAQLTQELDDLIPSTAAVRAR